MGFSDDTQCYDRQSIQLRGYDLQRFKVRFNCGLDGDRYNEAWLIDSVQVSVTPSYYDDATAPTRSPVASTTESPTHAIRVMTQCQTLCLGE